MFIVTEYAALKMMTLHNGYLDISICGARAHTHTHGEDNVRVSRKFRQRGGGPALTTGFS